MDRPVNHFAPALPVGAMKTYGILAPEDTHWREATCAEADCPNYLHGWRTPIDETTDQGQAQAWYIRNQSGRRFTEDRDQQPGLTVFTFEAGQSCFGARHRVRVGRPELYVVRGGDWRGSTGEMRRHANADDWLDDFGTHQSRLADQLQKG